MGIICPLCESQKIFTTRSFSISSLREEWSAAFSFDPFSDFPQLDETLKQHRCGICDLEFFSPQIAGSSDFYERLSRNNTWYYEENKWEFDEAIQRLSKNQQIETLLEIGCGKGFFLQKLFHFSKTLGIDINRDAVEICRNKGLNVSLERIESIEHKFDAIVSFEVLEHISNAKDFITNICKLLSPGGTLILAVPNPESYLREFEYILLDMPPHHLTKWSKRTFYYMASQFGLEIVGIVNEPLRYVHYQNYIHMLASQYQSGYGGGTLSQKIKLRLRNILMPILGEIIIPCSYQYHKQALLGQTHLVEFKKL
jgi:2-polyprenyl-3-methyl-5-hydroxy-6-metoxy-1,4-benzoquinol methylase